MALGLLLLVLVVVGLVFAYYLFTLSRAKHDEAIAQADENVAEQPEDERGGKTSRD